MTFESARRETQELQPIKSPADILARLTEGGKVEERRLGEMSGLDENVLTR